MVILTCICLSSGSSSISSLLPQISASPEMDSQNSNLTCAICLERFRIPVTIPCGHTFCHKCISTHWDTKSKSNIGPQCPFCNTKFESRPTLKRNVSLCMLTEATNSTGPCCRDSLTRGSEGARAMLLCDQHKKPLVYYCRNDRTPVCYECGISECDNHDKVLLETERENQEVNASRVKDVFHMRCLYILSRGFNSVQFLSSVRKKNKTQANFILPE